MALQRRLRRARRARRPGRRSAARGVPPPSGCSSRWAWPTPDSATPHVDRLGSCYTRDPGTGELVVYDAPDGQWASPPAFPSGGGGLVSTVDDFHAFARMLLAGGRLADGSRLLSPRVRRGDDDRPHRRRPGAPDRRPTVRRAGASASACSCAAPGWRPRSAATDGPAASGRRGPTIPASGLVGIVLTTDMFTGPFPPPPIDPGLLDLLLRGDR